MVEMKIIKGDATSPQAKGPKIVAHVCNDVGGWGKGFVLALSRRWPEPERDFRQWHRARAGNDFGLGATRLIQVTPDVWVANMVGQHGLKPGSAGPPVRYDAIGACLATVGREALRRKASVHMPRIGCGLAGGTWERIEPLVTASLCERDVAVTVYDFDERPTMGSWLC
ncbi:Appr-1-p processing protein [Actinoplanes sp. NPDC051851]|uniref:Appr-1-p processing protein n=1 Tax=Actinoplanes sp. NPDC051851 TaxID=3154753 RepID=UPI00343BA164